MLLLLLDHKCASEDSDPGLQNLMYYYVFYNDKLMNAKLSSLNFSCPALAIEVVGPLIR